MYIQASEDMKTKMHEMVSEHRALRGRYKSTVISEIKRLTAQTIMHTSKDSKS